MFVQIDGVFGGIKYDAHRGYCINDKSGGQGLSVNTFDFAETESRWFKMNLRASLINPQRAE
jgi:hypothetical protein